MANREIGAIHCALLETWKIRAREIIFQHHAIHFSSREMAGELVLMEREV